ncbi:MAG TPA: hypothetical protein VKH63_15540 [Candidatus Acidoferrum sp.]|nr:hypothetical protein [Candidatus Acidoferrum sp.]
MSLDDTEGLLHAMAYKFDGDPAATCATCVCGFSVWRTRNMKKTSMSRLAWNPPPLTISAISNCTSTPRTHVATATQTAQKRETSSRTNLSQSQHEWVFAERALARGEGPEEVIRRIADYRGGEKHSGYARHTVEKVQMELQQGAAHMEASEANAASASKPALED